MAARLALLLALAAPAAAVDRSKFRTCQQGAFCRRYSKYVQRLQSSGDFAHVLDPGSLALKEGDSLLVGLLQHRHLNGTGPPALQLSVRLLADTVNGGCGAVRLTIDDADSTRFRVPDGDVVVPGLQALPGALSVDAESARFQAPQGCGVRLQLQPLEIEVFAQDRVLQRLNERHLLNFEQAREKGAAAREGLLDATDVDSSAMWEEAFGEHLDSKPRGPRAVGLDATFLEAPIVAGLAEHTTKLHLGETGFAEPLRLYNLDVFEYEVDVPMSIYGNIPFVTAVHKFGEQGSASGLLVLNPSEGFVKVEAPSQEEGNSRTWWAFESGVLDVFSFLGPTPERVLQQYFMVTGWPRLPPMATLGKHQSRWNYVDVEDVLEVDASFDKADIPYDVLWLDLEHTDAKRYFTWHPKHFADAGRMLDSLAEKKRKVVTIIDPHIMGDGNYTAYQRLSAGEAFVRRSDGGSYEGFCWPGPSFYPDFCDPKTRKLWATLFDPEVYQHSRADLYTWNDMNEPSVFDGPEISMPRDVLHKCQGEAYDVEHRDVHNLYGFYHHQATVEGQLLRAPETRPFVLTRSFFAGSQRHGPVWTGDNTASWEHLSRSVPMLLSLSLCGLSFAGADVGGFMGDPSPDLLLRWHQLGIWYPFYRAHAHLTTKRREPWLLGAEASANIRENVLARYRLLPTWYTLLAEWALLGKAVLRPIWYGSLLDSAAYKHADSHFLVGESILVRAVGRQRSVEVYTPPGLWFDFWERGLAPREGGAAASVKAHAARVPVFVRQGAMLLEKMRRRRSAGAMLADPYTLTVFGAPAKSSFYVDDGRSADFSRGAFIYEEFTFDGTTLTARALALRDGGATQVPKVPEAGLRVERLVLLCLERKPRAARFGGRELVMRLEGQEGCWRAEVKEPGLRLGPPYSWALSLEF